MTRLDLALSLCAGLLACTPAPQNPPQLWLALNGSERAVKLVPVQPDPF